jgi:hypothetical protein
MSESSFIRTFFQDLLLGLAAERIPAAARKDRRMNFVLEVDMGDTAFDGKAAAELRRILRPRAGNLHHYELKPGDGSLSYDLGYHEVGGRPLEQPGTATSSWAGDLDGHGRAHT